MTTPSQCCVQVKMADFFNDSSKMLIKISPKMQNLSLFISSLTWDTQSETIQVASVLH